MTRRSKSAIDKSDPLRWRLAQESARIMIDQGIGDFLLAKRKAAERLRIRDQSVLPSNAEIESALAEQQRLFHADAHSEELLDLRRTALRLMRLLAEFHPRLVGPVLSGTATAHSEIQLHVFVDQPELVALKLLDHQITATHAEKKLRYQTERWVSYPSFRFLAGDQPQEIIVLTHTDMRQAPMSPIDGRPMDRADIRQVEQLL